MVVNNSETGPLAKRLFDSLSNIQTGKEADPFSWIVELKIELAKLA